MYAQVGALHPARDARILRRKLFEQLARCLELELERGQRRSKLMRCDRKKFIARADSFVRLPIQEPGIDRERRAPADFLAQREILRIAYPDRPLSTDDERTQGVFSGHQRNDHVVRVIDPVTADRVQDPARLLGIRAPRLEADCRDSFRCAVFEQDHLKRVRQRRNQQASDGCQRFLVVERFAECGTRIRQDAIAIGGSLGFFDAMLEIPIESHVFERDRRGVGQAFEEIELARAGSMGLLPKDRDRADRRLFNSLAIRGWSGIASTTTGSARAIAHPLGQSERGKRRPTSIGSRASSLTYWHWPSSSSARVAASAPVSARAARGRRSIRLPRSRARDSCSTTTTSCSTLFRSLPARAALVVRLRFAK